MHSYEKFLIVTSALYLKNLYKSKMNAEGIVYSKTAVVTKHSITNRISKSGERLDTKAC